MVNARVLLRELLVQKLLETPIDECTTTVEAWIESCEPTVRYAAGLGSSLAEGDSHRVAPTSTSFIVKVGCKVRTW